MRAWAVKVPLADRVRPAAAPGLATSLGYFLWTQECLFPGVDGLVGRPWLYLWVVALVRKQARGIMNAELANPIID